MTPCVEVTVVKDMLAQFNEFIAVIDACEVAGVSYPPEIDEFFGDALEQHGSDIDKLREAVEYEYVAASGDPFSEEGMIIRLDALPENAIAIRIRTTNVGAETELLASRA